ncbi:MAG: hypothetical protein EXS08_09350 [Planctomycetes bacterium]|nr:hypothetical protein [Planctomycetota bacterium]
MRRFFASLFLLASACASTDSGPDWSAVRTELTQRVALDQELRKQTMESAEVDMALYERLSAVDEENTAWMKALVVEHGWPTIARVGAEGAGNAWLLVQHADQDVDFQEQCLLNLREAVAQGQASKKNLAYLEDRVALHRARPQRYGTQFVQQDGKYVPHTLEDPARVDAWRAEVGLEPLAEYAKNFEEP